MTEAEKLSKKRPVETGQISNSIAYTAEAEPQLMSGLIPGVPAKTVDITGFIVLGIVLTIIIYLLFKV